MTQPTQSALFDGEVPEPRRNDRPEAAALVEVLQALRTHAAVAWRERMNSGAAKVGNPFIRFGFRGCQDVLDKGGLWLSVVTTGSEEMASMLSRLLPEGAIEDFEIGPLLSARWAISQVFPCI